jgi:hypothetical protein
VKVKNRETRRFAEELEGVRHAVAMGRRSNARALTRLDPAFTYAARALESSSDVCRKRSCGCGATATS